MPTAIFKCDVCGESFDREVLAGDCEWKHEKHKIQADVIAAHGEAVWNCVRAIEAWEGQKDWHMLVAEELTAMLNDRLGKPGVAHGKV